MQFYERNKSALAAEKEALEKQAAAFGNNAPMLYLPQGTSMVRILPPYSQAGLFFRKIEKHRVKVGNQTFIGSCPAAMADTYCPICVKGQEFLDSKAEDKVKFAKENLKARTTYLFNVLYYSKPANKKSKTPKFKKVYVLETNVTVHHQVMNLDQDEATGWADITSIENGVNLMIKRIGAGLDTKYEVHPHGGGRVNIWADLSARGVDPSTLTMINLDEVYQIPPQEKLEEVAGGINLGGFISHSAPRPIPVASPSNGPVASPAISGVVTQAAPPPPRPAPLPAPAATSAPRATVPGAPPIPPIPTPRPLTQ